VLERRSAWLFVNTQVKSCSRETHSLSRSPNMWTQDLSIAHIHDTVIATVAE